MQIRYHIDPTTGCRTSTNTTFGSRKLKTFSTDRCKIFAGATIPELQLVKLSFGYNTHYRQRKTQEVAELLRLGVCFYPPKTSSRQIQFALKVSGETCCVHVDVHGIRMIRERCHGRSHTGTVTMHGSFNCKAQYRDSHELLRQKSRFPRQISCKIVVY